MQIDLLIGMCINEINFLIFISDFYMQKIKKRKTINNSYAQTYMQRIILLK